MTHANLLTILVVDREVLVRQVLETILEREGYTVLPARDVTHALDIMRAAAVDLVLMDISRANLETVDSITDIRRRFPAVKVVGMSGALDPAPLHVEWTCTHAFLPKPIRRDALRNTVHRLLARHANELVGHNAPAQ